MKSESTLVLAIVVLFAASASAGTYSGGDGSAENPYRIATPNDLNDIGSYPEDFNDCFILVNDINMAGYTYTTALIAPDISSQPYFQGTQFTGIFNGNDHAITNFTIDTSGAGNDFLGLFGYIGSSGYIMNLGIEDANISGGYGSIHLGGLIGANGFYQHSTGGRITNCYSTGIVSSGDESSNLGGLAGNNSKGTICNCYSTCTITSGNETQNLGGLVGVNDEGIITDCHATGDVSGRDWHIGGLVGWSLFQTSFISHCHATGNVTSTSDWVGGLVGSHGGSISYCCATGDVTGIDHVGGLVGVGRTSNSYATGTVTGHYYVGGLVGDSFFGTVTNCYTTGQVQGDQDVGGLVGYGGTITASFWDIETGGSDNGFGTPLTTAQMQTKSTFTDAGWDFLGESVNGMDDIWRLCEDDVNYPKLSWQFALGDFNCPDGVDVNDLLVLSEQWLLEELSADVWPDGGDGVVDFLDWAIFADGWQISTGICDLASFAEQWLQTGANYYIADIAPGEGDGRVNFLDFAVFADYWLEGVEAD